MERYRIYDHDGLVEEVELDDDAFVDFLLDLLAEHQIDVLTVEEDEAEKRLLAEEEAAATDCPDCAKLRAGSCGAGRFCPKCEAHLDLQDVLEGRDEQ